MTRAELERAAVALGLRLVPEHKLREPMAQLVAAMKRQGVDAVIDVGANIGQYAGILRATGWSGPIVSFEPLPSAHAELAARAACDPGWTVPPTLALADRGGTATIERSAESDMSSLLPQGELLRRLSPSSAVIAAHEVPVQRLDHVAAVAGSSWRRMFVKVDVQGAESAVLAGIGNLWPRVQGLQLELPLVPLYEGERPWRETLDEVCARGFAPWLFIPGYFERHLARQLQLDIALFREPAGVADCDRLTSPPT
jgi:FkbM family methyltransferase